MRQWINNPRFVLAMVAVAGLLIAWQYVPVDWGRKWENLLLGEVAQLAAEPVNVSTDQQIPVTKLFGAQPKNLPADAEKLVGNLAMDRALFPVPASPAEKKWQQQDEGPRFPAGLRLEAVYESGNQTAAVLSGNIVREGDFLRGAQVTRITRDRVTFLWNDSLHDLLLGGDVGVLQESKESQAETAKVDHTPAETSALLQGELDRLQELQKLLETPAKLLKGSEQVAPR